MTEREQVVAAAQAVMGWKVAGTEVCQYIERNGRRIYPCVDWNPTRSISDAWMLLDKLEAQGWAYSVSPRRCGIWKPLGRSLESCHVESANGDSTPAAITLACLRAVGVDA